MTDIQVATTILNQMRVMDQNLCWCMGVTKPTAIKSGLEFKVSGLRYRGKVQIILNGKDLYDVKVGKAMHKDIFVEDLMPLLEMEVERQ